MARNTLEAVFGALGSGLVGYGRDQKRRYDESQDAADREERRKRQELADALQAAEMMESGRWGSEAQLRERTGGAARSTMAAALSGFNASRGGPSRPVVPTDVATAMPTMQRGMNAPQVSVGGQDLRMLQTADDERRMAQAQGGMDRAANRADTAERDTRLHKFNLEESAARTAGNTAANDRADRQDRTRRANAEYIQRSKGRTVPPKYEGGQSTVQPYTPAELKALREEVYAGYGITPSGEWLPEGYVPTPFEEGPPPSALSAWVAKNRKLPNESEEDYRARATAGMTTQSPSATAPESPRAAAVDPREPVMSSQPAARQEPSRPIPGAAPARAREIRMELARMGINRNGFLDRLSALSSMDAATVDSARTAGQQRYAESAPRRDALTKELLDLGYVLDGMGSLRPAAQQRGGSGGRFR